MRRVRAARRGAALAIALVTAVVLALPLLAGADPLDQDLSLSLAGPSAAHPFGTDQFGRDIAARLAEGTGRSYRAALAVVAASILVGLVIGAAATALPRGPRWAIDRAIDVFLGLPGIVVALAVVGVLGPGQRNLVIALIVGVWPWYARLAREHTATLLREPFVDAARIAGSSRWRIWHGHLLPHLVRRLAIIGALDVGYTIVAFAGLSYLGLGIQQPEPDLGTMLREGQDFFLNAPWLLIGPSGAIALIVLPFVIAGERGHARGIGL